MSNRNQGGVRIFDVASIVYNRRTGQQEPHHFRAEVDLDLMIRRLGTKALFNKSRRSKMVGVTVTHTGEA